MAAMVKNVQAVAKECQRANPKIEMAAVSVQPKIEVVKKVVADHIDLVVLGHGRYPSDAMGNVASYVVCFCCACVCLYGDPADVFILRVRTTGRGAETQANITKGLGKLINKRTGAQA